MEQALDNLTSFRLGLTPPNRIPASLDDLGIRVGESTLHACALCLLERFTPPEHLRRCRSRLRGLVREQVAKHHFSKRTLRWPHPTQSKAHCPQDTFIEL